MAFRFINSMYLRVSRIPERHDPAPSPFPHNLKAGDISTLSCFRFGFFFLDQLTFRKKVPLCYRCPVEMRLWAGAEKCHEVNASSARGQSRSFAVTYTFLRR